MVKPYGVKNEISPMKKTYGLAIPETLVPIENPIGHLHRPAKSVFKNKIGRAARAQYIENHNADGLLLESTSLTMRYGLQSINPSTFSSFLHHQKFLAK